MSSLESAAIPFDMPHRLLAARVSDALSGLTVGMVGWVASLYGTAALSLAAAGAAAVVLACIRGPDRPAGSWQLAAGAATRQLGSTLVVEGRHTGSGRSVGPAWLTRADVPGECLRRLAIQLRADSPTPGS
jgi:hypothetical protein